MKRILLVLMMLFLMLGVANANTIYTGTLDTNAGVFATAPWDNANGGFKITWDNFQTGNLFTYNYEITNLEGGALGKDVSNFVFQVSDNFTIVNLKSFSGGTVSSDSPKSFNGIFGIKVEDMPETGTVSLTFTSDRMPMWGDFHAKAGKNTEAYNMTGYQIGVPDTQVVPIPNTGILFLGGMVLMTFVGARKRDA